MKLPSRRLSEPFILFSLDNDENYTRQNHKIEGQGRAINKNYGNGPNLLPAWRLYLNYLSYKLRLPYTDLTSGKLIV